MEADVIKGYYGCDCHPFQTLKELKAFEKQKLNKGQIVKLRCTGVFSFVIGLVQETRFYNIDVLPCKYERDKQQEHVSNLIPESKFSVTEKEALQNVLKLTKYQKILRYRQTSLLQ